MELKFVFDKVIEKVEVSEPRISPDQEFWIGEEMVFLQVNGRIKFVPKVD